MFGRLRDKTAAGSAAAGAIGYAAFNLLPNPLELPGAHHLNFRPGVVIPILFGVLFGPIVGFIVGTAGALISDLPTYGISWNWEIGYGLVGLIAGFASGSFKTAGWPRDVIAATAVAALAIIVGIGLAALADIWVANLTADAAIGVEGIPIATWNAVWGVPLTLASLLAWRRWRRAR
jgi:energy-coupling factor transport system substrate-specific component